jgi:hypothetical protein
MMMTPIRLTNLQRAAERHEARNAQPRGHPGKTKEETTLAMTTDDFADIGPTPPPWMPPDAQPDYWNLYEGKTSLLWLHGVGDHVTIECHDTIEDEGEWMRTAKIDIIQHLHGLDPALARRLAAELNAAADLIDEYAADLIDE